MNHLFFYIKIAAWIPISLIRKLLYEKSKYFRDAYISKVKYKYINETTVDYRKLKEKYMNFKNLVNLSENINKKTVLEIGPGNNLLFGVLSIIDGVKKYIGFDIRNNLCVDQRFDNLYKQAGSNKYRLKTEGLDRTDCFSSKHLDYIINSKGLLPLKTSSVDVIYSCSVLGQVTNLDQLFAEMKRVLKNNGIMNHQVDLRDHYFDQKSLFFLKLNNSLHDLIFKDTTCYTNRKRLADYLNLFDKYKLSVERFKVDIWYPKSVTDEHPLKNEIGFNVASFNVVLKNR